MPRRTDRAGLLLVVCAVPTLLLGLAAPARSDDGHGLRTHELAAFTDPRVIESSGLVDRGRLLFTINDSGDGPYVYAVDPRTGATTAVTTYSPDGVEDVEAIAPGRGGTLWVGDIGDNRASRTEIDVYHLRPSSTTGTVPSTRYRFRYPDGPRDAETLLVDPRTGRLLVVSKSVFGGTVFLAPRHLDPAGVNPLRPFADVGGLVTDGSFFPDGKHVVLRTYDSATTYSYPDFHPLGTVQLPAQPQGEGISVGAAGRVLLSSEGLHSRVLQIHLPASMTARPVAASAPASPTPSPAPKRYGLDPPNSPTDWWRAGGVGVVLAGAAYGVSRLLRGRR